MRAQFEIPAPTLNKLPIVVEDRDCILASIVDQNPVLRIDLDAMRVTPAYAVWQRAPVRHKLIGMLPTAECRGFFSKQQHGSDSGGGHAPKQGAPANVPYMPL